MNDDALTQNETLIELIENQIDILLAMILRPVVQQQILALLVILLIAWIIPDGFRYWWRKRQQEGNPKITELSKHQRRLAGLYHLVTPVFALVLLNLTIQQFAVRHIPNGLLENVTNIIWLWLIYRALVTFLFVRFGEELRPYRNWIITPIFLFFVILEIFKILPGSVALISATITLGATKSTFGDIMFAAVVMYLFIITAWVLKQMMMHYLPQQLDAEPGVVESIATLTRYALLSIGLIVSLGLLGLDFTSLAIVAGGLSVGIGIGLQEIVANFVSGLVLLFEQSLRPGDVVELDGRINQVEKISLRATTVRTRTNEELIIPNSNFTTQQVKNLTKTDRMIQIRVPFGVGYNSNPPKVRELAIATSLKHPLVLSFPAPIVHFTGYGESSLDFELRVSTHQPELTLRIRSDLYFSLWDVFVEHGVEIPFPQRDLNLRTGWEQLLPEKSNQQGNSPEEEQD